MRNKIIGAGAFVVLAVLAVLWSQRPDPVAFPHLVGPIEATELPSTPTPTSIEAYTAGGSHSLAIYLRDTDSAWQGLALGLKSKGVPFRIVTNLDAALAHNVVLVYPSLTGANASAALLNRLAEHLDNGGTVLGFSVVGGGMRPLFGYETSQEHARRWQMSLQPSDITRGLTDNNTPYPVPLGNIDDRSTGLPGTHYTGLDQPPIALFEDGTAAITYKTHRSDRGTGHAYVFGQDIGYYIQRAYNGRFPTLSSDYVNTYQPTVDNLLRLIANIYQQGEPNAVLLSPTAHGRDFTALITHDVDFTQSIENVPAYVELAQRFDVPSTFFIQTKYVTDFNDAAFFDASRADTLALLRDTGMEIASHTVAHSNELQRMPIGTGEEQYPSYRPFVRDFNTVRDATVMGELRVSKFLLEELAGTPVRSFRPGHLSLPAELPQLLVANDYQYSSSITANEALTHLPYRLMHDRGYTSQVNAYEFPVTIEDEAGRLGDRFDEAVALSNQIAQYNGLVNILIHTDTLDHKLEFQRRYLETFQDRAWFTTVSGYGDWWSVRDTVVTDVRRETDASHRLVVDADGALDGLTLRVPGHWRYESGLAGTQQAGDRLILGEFSGRAELIFQSR